MWNQALWLDIDTCPGCKSEAKDSCGKLPYFSYRFGKEEIPFPQKGIPLVQCKECGLAYKAVVPSPAFLTEVFQRQGVEIWGVGYDFAAEIEVIRKLKGREAFDLLDVGASNGDLLKAFPNNAGRKSAMDVIKYQGIENHIQGEFIQGFLDQHAISWSGEPYAVVTLFDVFEHLYEPEHAFKNLSAFTQTGGIVLLETGDVENYWPQRFGANHWWYVSLFQHHIFWSRRSLERIATKHGFEIIYWANKSHKNLQLMTLEQKIRETLKIGLYHILSPNRYINLVRAIGKEIRQPISPYSNEHMLVCLRKISNNWNKN